MKFSFLPLLALLLALVSCESNLDTNYPVNTGVSGVGAVRGANDIVQVGDKLEIYVLEDETFNGIYTVRDGGHIIFPKVGRVQVAGKSLAEAELTIKQAFEGPAQLFKTANIILERHGARAQASGPNVVRVYLNGAVTRPGPLAVPYIDSLRPTAYQAVVHGGGVEDFANLKRAYIVRNTGSGQQRIELNLADIGKGDSIDMPIEDGDIIVIPQKKFLF